MATITAVATTAPDHLMTSQMVKEGLAQVFSEHPRVRTALAMVDRTGVHNRHMVLSLPQMLEPRGLETNNDLYQLEAVRLGEHVAREVLERAQLAADAIDAVITVSCTGFMIPSLDAHLINLLGMRSDVCRLPITELGCAAGAVALSRAADFIAAGRAKHVMVVAVELPSLTFQHGDSSMANLVSAALFGDGAAACIVSSERKPGFPRIVASRSHLFPETIDAMGFQLKDEGFHIVLAQEVSELITRHIRPLVDGFLADQGKTCAQLQSWVLHPGGRRIMEGMTQELALSPEQTQASWSILGEFGNLSSASVLFVLQRHLDTLRTAAPQPGRLGLLAAFGPGFSAELQLLEWN